MGGVSTPLQVPALAAPATANWHRWFPNALTALRLVIAMGFFVLLAVGDYPVRELVVTPKHPLWQIGRAHV